MPCHCISIKTGWLDQTSELNWFCVAMVPLYSIMLNISKGQRVMELLWINLIVFISTHQVLVLLYSQFALYLLSIRIFCSCRTAPIVSVACNLIATAAYSLIVAAAYSHYCCCCLLSQYSCCLLSLCQCDSLLWSNIF